MPPTGSAALGRFRGLLRRLEIALHPKEKLLIIEQLHRWSTHHGTSLLPEDQNTPFGLGQHKKEYAELAARKGKLTAQLADLGHIRASLDKDLHIDRHMAKMCQRKRAMLDAKLNDLDAERQRLLDFMAENSVSNPEGRTQVQEKLREMRHSSNAIKLQIEAVDSKISDHLHYIATQDKEFELAEAELSDIKRTLIEINDKLKDIESKHIAHVAQQDYLKRRSNIIHEHAAARKKKKLDIMRRKMMADAKYRPSLSVSTESTRTISPSRPNSGGRKPRCKTSPRMKIVAEQLNCLRASLNLYERSAPQPGVFGRTASKSPVRPPLVKVMANKGKKSKSSTVFTPDQEIIPAEKSVSYIETNQSPAEIVPAATKDRVFQVGNLVWVQFVDDFGKLHERHPAKIESVHKNTSGCVVAYDVLHQLDSFLERAVDPRRLFMRHSVKVRACGPEFSPPDLSSEWCSNPGQDDKNGNAYEHSARTGHVEDKFKSALQHQNWGPDFRKKWDDGAARARIAAIPKAKIVQRRRPKKVSSRGRDNSTYIVPQYSFHDSIFRGCPNGAGKRFYIVPRAHKASVKRVPVNSKSHDKNARFKIPRPKSKIGIPSSAFFKRVLGGLS